MKRVTNRSKINTAIATKSPFINTAKITLMFPLVVALVTLSLFTKPAVVVF